MSGRGHVAFTIKGTRWESKKQTMGMEQLVYLAHVTKGVKRRIGKLLGLLELWDCPRS